MKFPKIPETVQIARLQPPSGHVRMVLDTDTYNEVDDQFAIAYALRSPEKMTVEAIYAAPFYNGRSNSYSDGMERSYEEILQVLALMKNHSSPPVYKGSTDYLNPQTLEKSDAVLDLIERALTSPKEDPLYVVAIGAITNVATAILLEPKIIEHIVVVWLAGHALYWPDTNEFNMRQDVPASQVMFDCGVPLVHIPCMNVATHLRTTVSELEAYLYGRNQLSNYLVEIVKGYSDNHFGWSKVLWDIANIAYLVNPEWVQTYLVHSPILTDQVTWSVDPQRHFIRSTSYIDRDPVYRDLFTKLGGKFTS